MTLCGLYSAGASLALVLQTLCSAHHLPPASSTQLSIHSMRATASQVGPGQASAADCSASDTQTAGVEDTLVPKVE